MHKIVIAEIICVKSVKVTRVMINNLSRYVGINVTPAYFSAVKTHDRFNYENYQLKNKTE